MKKTFLRGVVAGAAATGRCCHWRRCPHSAMRPPGTQVQLLNITDFHGRIAEVGRRRRLRRRTRTRGLRR